LASFEDEPNGEGLQIILGLERGKNGQTGCENGRFFARNYKANAWLKGIYVPKMKCHIPKPHRLDCSNMGNKEGEDKHFIPRRNIDDFLLVS
jgi:hypothetical protein